MPLEPRRRALDRIATQVHRCTRCALHESREHAVPGEGPVGARLLLIGEAPGRVEDQLGRPFRGAAGKFLDEALRRAGIRRDRTFITNTVKCRPPGNRNPRGEEMTACRPYLIAQIAAVRPRVIVSLGETAARNLLGGGVPFSRVRGRWARFADRPMMSTYHPAAVLYNRRLLPTLVSDLRKANARAGRR